ncbi:MAG: zinc-dependent alcohol dehydrogenase family protein [Pricia sp.]
MKAIQIKEYGENATFQVAEVDKPEVKSGHVLIKIAASSVNTVDTKIRKMGNDLPFAPETPAILGMDFAGTIEEVGEGVTDYSVSDEVYGCAGGLGDLQGTLAEYLVADVQLIAHKPKNLTMREAAAIPLAGITAYEGLTRAGVTQGQKLLVQGGAGGVGHLAIQLAKHLGATVFATERGAKSLQLMEQLGGTAIDFTSEEIADYVEKYTDGAGFDVVFDTIGGDNLTNSFEAAALNAQIATTVAMTELDLAPTHMKGLSLHVVFMLIPMIHNHHRSEHAKILKEIAKIVEAGEMKPVVDEKHFSLEEVGEAHAHLESGNAIGKVVVEN